MSVWHVLTGKLRFRFYNAHGDLRITAMNFDAARRRLLTGELLSGTFEAVHSRPPSREWVSWLLPMRISFRQSWGRGGWFQMQRQRRESKSGG